MIERIDRKRQVLTYVAKYCFEGTLDEHKDHIPLELVPHGRRPSAAASIASARFCATAWIGHADARPYMTESSIPARMSRLPS